MNADNENITVLVYALAQKLHDADLWLCCMSLMKDLLVLCFGEKSGIRKFVILGHRAE